LWIAREHKLSGLDEFVGAFRVRNQPVQIMFEMILADNLPRELGHDRFSGSRYSSASLEDRFSP
jgi:hypothetical protein